MSGPNLEMVKASWGDDAPDWVVLLAEQCDLATQKSVAAAMGYSNTVVNTVLKRRYTGDLTAVEQALRGAFEAATVECPVLGTLPRQHCQQHQRAPFASTNPTRVRLYRACRAGCPHSRLDRR